MVDSSKTVLILGATGLTGNLVVKKLFQYSAISKVYAITRRPLGLTHDKLVEIKVDNFDSLAELKLDLVCDIAFSCLGTTLKKAGSKEEFVKVDQKMVLDFAKLAKLHGVYGFVCISGFGANPRSPIFYNRIKGLTDDGILSLGFPRTIIFRPSLLLGNRQESRPAEFFSIQLVSLLKKFLPSKLGKYLGSDVDLLAERMIIESLSMVQENKIIEAPAI